MPNITFAQDTWQEIYTLLQTNCSGSGCHSGSRPDFDVSKSSSVLYDKLIEGTPLNPTAAGKGNVYIDPGYPVQSFLLRKISHCIDNELALEQPQEGAYMPESGIKLADVEIELIRQWIIQGAPETGTIIGKQAMEAYYANPSTRIPRMQPVDPPLPCEGFQVHLGPLFFLPGEEKEFFKKFDLRLTQDVEINKIEVSMNDFSHHFLIYTYEPGTAANWPDAIQPLNPVTAFDADKNFLLAWQDNYEVKLPNGTAYSFEAGKVLDLNYHVKNYDTDKYFASDVYVNFYTQPEGTAAKEIIPDLVYNFNINIPSDSQVHILKNTANFSNISIFNLTTHAHSRSIDYDVYLKNLDNSRGAQIYEGTYDYVNGFNTGVYSFDHPPSRFFDPLFDMTGYKGIIQEAKYINTTGQTKTFGFTTNDEMMISYIQYVNGTHDPSQYPEYVADCSTNNLPYYNCFPVSVSTIETISQTLHVYPNPSRGEVSVTFVLDKNRHVKSQLYDIAGKFIADVFEGNMTSGSQSFQINEGLMTINGMYVLKTTIDGEAFHKTIMRAE